MPGIFRTRRFTVQDFVLVNIVQRHPTRDNTSVIKNQKPAMWVDGLHIRSDFPSGFSLGVNVFEKANQRQFLRRFMQRLRSSQQTESGTELCSHVSQF